MPNYTALKLHLFKTALFTGLQVSHHRKATNTRALKLTSCNSSPNDLCLVSLEV